MYLTQLTVLSLLAVSQFVSQTSRRGLMRGVKYLCLSDRVVKPPYPPAERERYTDE